LEFFNTDTNTRQEYELRDPLTNNEQCKLQVKSDGNRDASAENEFEQYKEKAEQGDALAQCRLGK
jgi:hypothetical protein